MSASLVGSEMCIRDRTITAAGSGTQPGREGQPAAAVTSTQIALPDDARAVSYTHLTLPTICSV
eukprot:10182405-Alexandrium_andersonii.AAC.1